MSHFPSAYSPLRPAERNYEGQDRIKAGKGSKMRLRLQDRKILTRASQQNL